MRFIDKWGALPATVVCIAIGICFINPATYPMAMLFVGVGLLLHVIPA